MSDNENRPAVEQHAYEPSSGLVSATLAALTKPLPWLITKAFGFIPVKLRESVVAGAIKHILPAVLHSSAAAKPIGFQATLIKNGTVEEEVRRGFIRRIANFLLPDEVHTLTEEFRDELQRLAQNEFTAFSWSLRVAGENVVLITTGESPITEYAGTVVDALNSSFPLPDSLRKLWKLDTPRL